MSTSDTLNGGSLTIGGVGGQHMFVNWQLASQNTGGNFSTINWQAYFHYNSADAQLDNGRVDSNAGNLWANGGRVHNYAGTFTTRDLALSSGTFNLGHNSDGTGTLTLSCSIVVYQTGTSSGSSGWSLPTIARFANITSNFVDNQTDTTLRLNWSADNNCDYISWWSSMIDGGAHHDIPVSGSGLFQVTPSNLLSNTTYDFNVAVRRADSGLWTTSGTFFGTTLVQNKFFDIGDY